MNTWDKEVEAIEENQIITSAGLAADWTQLKRESRTLKMGQQKAFNLNLKEERE